MSARERKTREAIAAKAGIGIARIIDIIVQEEHFPCRVKPTGSVGPTPPMSVRCRPGFGGGCTPSENPTQPWEYDIKLWNDPMWKHAQFEGAPGDHYHYRYEWAPNDDRLMPCAFTVQAFGDLDDDGVYSTFERHFPPKGDYDNNPTRYE